MTRSARQIWSRQRLEHERNLALGAVLESASHISYSSATRSYISFCNNHNIPITPTPDTLSLYIAYTTHFISPRSVNSYLSGICHNLQTSFPEIRESRRHPLVTNTLKGCFKLNASPTNRRPALQRQQLSIAIRAYPTPNYDDSLFLAILLTGFYGLMRLGELVWPDKTQLQDYRKIIRRQSVQINNLSYSFLLPYHKADRLFEGNRILIQSVSDIADPLDLFAKYIKLRDTSFPFHHELFLRQDGSIPTRSWFMARLTTLFPKGISGHSLRAGGATAYAVAGVPHNIIQALGRWQSDTFQIYIRQHPALLAALSSSL